MKIAILYSHLSEFGGAERIVLKEAELLQSRGKEVYCFFAYIDRKMLREDLLHYTRIVRSYFPNFLNDETLKIALSFPLAPLISKTFKSMDILLCHGYGPSSWIGYNTKLFSNIEYVNYIHSVPRFLYLEPEERKLWRHDPLRSKISILSQIFKPIVKAIDKLGVINSRFILANSHYTAKKIKEIYNREALVCYPFVDINLFKPLNESSIQKLFPKYGFSRPVLLSTGRIVPIRRIEWLIDVIKYLVKEFPSVTLVITGRVSRNNINYVRQLLKKASRLGVRRNIRLPGFVKSTELAKLYNIADVYVHPCPHEAFGLSPLEAMACGTPAVVWNDGSGPSETVLDGKTGFKAKPYEIEDFAGKVVKALCMDKFKMGEFAHKYVKENFSHEKHINVLERIFMKC